MAMIDPHDDDFGAICNCAVRYAVGRRTYMPGLVIDFITSHLSELTDKTLWCFQQDHINVWMKGLILEMNSIFKTG